MMKKCRDRLISGALAVVLLGSPGAWGDTIVWDFEGGGNGTLGDTTGTLFFNSSVDPFTNDTTWSVGGNGLTQPINYDGPSTNDDRIGGEHNSRDDNGVNDWFLRSDHNRAGGILSKNGDGASGTLISDSFIIDQTSAFSFYLGGGSTAGFLELIDASDDSVILTASPAANGHIYREGANSQTDDGFQEWTSSDLTGAGVTGATDVYLSITDSRGGGWGHVQVDDIVAENVSFVPGAPGIASFTSTPTELIAPGQVTLSWDVDESATSITIDQGVGDVTGQTEVTVNLTETTTFTLTAANANGSRMASVEISVAQMPVINSFTASAESLFLGRSVDLSWDVDFADTLSIDGGVGNLTEAVGTVTATPATTTTYTLTATNLVGTVTADVTVTVRTDGIVWDFEGGGTGTLGDISGTYFFRNTLDPAGNDTSWSVGGVGDTNPVRYDAINDSQPDAPGNDWFLRCDWNTPDAGATHLKHGDGRTGVLRSDSFVITEQSSITFEIGGSDATEDGFFLRRASDDSVILDARDRQHIASNADGEWTSSDLANAGVLGSTEVYLTIEDNTVGGWGHMQMDNITVLGVSGGGGGELAITGFALDDANGTATLTWSSRVGASYRVLWSPDLDFSGEFEIDDGIQGQDGLTTLGPFPVPTVPGGGTYSQVFFRVEESP